MARGVGAVKEIDIDDDYPRGKRINRDVPEAERRRVSSKKSDARKQMLRRKRKAQEEKDAERLEEERKKTGVKTRKRRKKKVEDDEPVARKKKRKRKTTGELLSSGRTKQAQRRLKNISSKATVISERNDLPEDVIGELMAMPADLTSESDFLNEYQHIYTTMGTIIRALEDRMMDPESKYGVSSKDVYALMTMYSQMRETIADMRSIKDMNAQAEDIAISVFDPATKSAGESLINIYFKITASVRQHVDDPKVIETLLEKLKQDVAMEAGELQNQFSLSRAKILEVLSGV